MTEQMTQEQILEEQKKNCIFCKILDGEMESKKVYEDDHFLVILDIRPAADGHILILPKEHVPILPLLPFEQQQALFRLSRTLSDILREVRAAENITVFSASGGVAGQQAPHMVLHLIPREPGDGLGMLDLSQRTVDQTDTLALEQMFTQATQQVVQQLGRADILGKEAPPTQGKIEPVPASFDEPEATLVPENTPEPVKDTKPVVVETPVEESTAPDEVMDFESADAALQALLMQNQDLRRMIISEPALVEDYIANSENLKKLFEGVNLKALSMALRKQEPEPEKTASQMTDAELFAFVDGNEGLRSWLVEHPEELAANIGQNAKLQVFLSGVDILELAKKYKAFKEGSS